MSAQAESGVPVLTVDGPGGSGKGTLAMRLATYLGWNFLDSGALYRIVAVAAAECGVDLQNGTALAELARSLNTEFRFDGDKVVVILDGQDVTGRLRLEETGTAASMVASQPEVRDALSELQKSFRKAPGLVADGRDMGTVIFPDAPLKIFLTASAHERAKRRYKQLKEKGESVNLSRLFRDIEQRDERDQTRAVAPLKPAADAVVIDSTHLGIDEVLQIVINLLKEKGISS